MLTPAQTHTLSQLANPSLPFMAVIIKYILRLCGHAEDTDCSSDHVRVQIQSVCVLCCWLERFAVSLCLSSLPHENPCDRDIRTKPLSSRPLEPRVTAASSNRGSVSEFSVDCAFVLKGSLLCIVTCFSCNINRKLQKGHMLSLHVMFTAWQRTESVLLLLPL